MAVDFTPIPGPSGIPFVGNIYDVDQVTPIKSLEHLAEIYGPIYQLSTFGKRRIIISSRDLVDEVCNEDRFTKTISEGLNQVRNGVQDGLFTARFGEHKWGLAHRILVPAFGPLTIRDMFDDMYDIATQLAMKWARQGAEVSIEASDDFTRLTLDTLALCTMGARFNSYYKENMHPFVYAMTRFLLGSGKRAARPAILNSLLASENAQYDSDIALMQQVAKDLVQGRRDTPSDQKDILNAMLQGRDPKTGEGLNDSTIVNNMITFLIAGHETTSGALSFLMYFLLKTPHAYRKLQDEIDVVVGRNQKVTLDHLSKLPYLNACLRESLRLRPTAPAFSVGPHPEKNHEDPISIGNGRYKVDKGDSIVLLLSKAMRDPAVWGPDTEDFKPERMLDEEFAKLPKNSWKPFGNGLRGCIGRPFAWQEMLLVMAVLMQNFNFSMANPGYDIQIKQTLTIKPKDFFIHATLREGLTATKLGRLLNNETGSSESGSSNEDIDKQKSQPTDKKPMHVYYGSNTGTCEALAKRLVSDAARYGYAAEAKELDTAIQKIPQNEPVVIITASYEGKPPDNAAHFYEWLSNLKETKLQGVSFAVFGCGHRDWQATFQKVPTQIDQMLVENGATQLCERGFADAATSDIFSDFDSWTESSLWQRIAETFGSTQIEPIPTSALHVKVSTKMRATILGHKMEEGIVLESERLTHPDAPAKRHVKFRLPEDMTYQPGDYLAVLPMNPPSVVQKALRRFNLPSDAILEIQKPDGLTSFPPIPLDVPVSAVEILSAFVELSQPACNRDIKLFVEAAVSDEQTQQELRALAASEELQVRRSSPLDLLIKYPAIDISIGDYITMLPPMRVRQYSISSSPLLDPSECTISFSVIDTPLAIDKDLPSEGRYLGVASNYLSNLNAGDKAHIAVRTSQNGFKPPKDTDVPMIMVCAGSGLAPFRGSIMDRAERIKARRTSTGQVDGFSPAKAILYVGCRTKGHDDIYANELAEWHELGAVDVRWAYSRPEAGESQRQYVQDLILEDHDDLVDMFEKGALLYVCGNVAVGDAVRDSMKKVYLKERRIRIEKGTWKGNPIEGDDESGLAEEWLNGLRAKERFATDVFT
ncbi:Oxidoreductase FAD/NAD(P)-binding [Penicillium expansum]|uniref:Bifunctional cytochrome P450/NADPH--P450 reductase n=1 Tax=Penicillium expansum TaxID=27334 RepID=A0A0A2JSP7_PENEN|nr:Oxidoreductase FAD/NAD(P)-binding [Penicillium expansum]KGO57871.1 Oxidoreductase FAD/NAD(P)-binding [Penicillium expansum]